MITLGANFKSMFFDRQKVIDKTAAAERKVLSKFGAYVRQTAKNLLRYRTKSSAPGQPPSVHRSATFRRKAKNSPQGKLRHASPLKELIYFGYDSNRRSVVIGPVAFASTNGEAPRVLEYGGTEEIRRPNGTTVTAHYAPRPFMGPAKKKEMPKLPGMWADSIK